VARRGPSTSARRQRLRDFAYLGAAIAALVAASFLPPDTSLRDVDAAGTLRACMPSLYPPLVTGDPERPGIELELLDAIARELGLRLQPVVVPTMGGDFDPRNWRVTRAQCSLLAGGVVDASVTRSFLAVAAPYAETGWAAVAGDAARSDLVGARVGFFAGLSGLDRIALSRWLRERGAVVEVVSRADELAVGLRSGAFDVAVTEAMNARRLAEELETTAAWLPLEGTRTALAFGFWKGDATLRRAVAAALDRLDAGGHVAAVLDRYQIAPIVDDCAFCR
jgi:polar amino acid transport system substrate-binding protein/cystine transport system substrate-binding protein/membrane-bound lytic murein transglycosylase F